MKIIKEENELEKRAKFNRKHNKGLGWFVNPDAGNVEYNNAFFNAAMNAAESPSTNPTGPMAENIEEENMKLIKESKQVVKETFDPDVRAKRVAEYRRLAGLSDDDTITESSLDNWALKAAATRNRCSVEDMKECLFESVKLTEDTLKQVADQLNAEVATKGDIEEALDRSLKLAKRYVRQGKRSDFPNVLLIGEGGTGKSSRIRKWAHENNVNLLEKRIAGMEPTDLSGPMAPDFKGSKVADRLSSIEFDPLNRPNSVLFLDEYNRATSKVRTNLLELVNSHLLPDAREDEHQRFLPNFLFTIAAINPSGSRYDTNELDDAEVTRFRTINVEFDPLILNDHLSKEFDEDAADPENDEEERLEYIRKKAITNKLLTSKKFSFDTPEERDEGRERYGQFFRPLDYRSFTGLVKTSDGTKEDLLALWPQFANPAKKRMAEDILADYVDVDDKANAALARGTKSEVFAKTKNLWDVFVDKYGDQVGL